MCTVTWWRGRGEYELFFNRDELKARLPALPPRPCEAEGGVRYLAPADGDFGGTWLWVNERGLTVGLLNHYPEGAPEPAGEPISRGLLVSGLAPCGSPVEVGARLADHDLRPYRPFILIALLADEPARRWVWDGRRLSGDARADETIPFTSSSFETAEVERERLAHFSALLPDGEAPCPLFLERFHTSRQPGRGAYSIMMERDDAATVSLSRIHVSPAEIRFTYTPVLPGGDRFGTPVVARLEPAAVRA